MATSQISIRAAADRRASRPMAAVVRFLAVPFIRKALAEIAFPCTAHKRGNQMRLSTLARNAGAVKPVAEIAEFVIARPSPATA